MGPRFPGAFLIVEYGAPQTDLDKLLHAARQGSASSREQVLQSCHAYLIAIANEELEPWMQGKVGASDWVQNTYVNAHENFHDFRGDSEQELRGWLRKILLSQKQATIRTFRFTEKRSIEREVSLSSDVLRNATLRRNPLSELLRQENAAQLKIAIQQLSDDYRRVIELRSIEQLTFVQVGELMDRSEEAARKLWRRAIIVLSELLGGSRDFK